MIIWLTGASGTGKTTLAKEVQKTLPCIVLDGNEMRQSISVGSGFSKEERAEHNYRVARLAKVLERQGFLVIVSVISPFEEIRQRITGICNPEWICLPTIRQEKVKDNPYEKPKNASLYLENMTIEEEVEKLLGFISKYV